MLNCNHERHDYNLASILIFAVLELWLKSKFPYAIWFEAGSKLVADMFEAKFHHAIWSKTGLKLVRSWLQTCSELKFGLSSSFLAAN